MKSNAYDHFMKTIHKSRFFVDEFSSWKNAFALCPFKKILINIEKSFFSSLFFNIYSHISFSFLLLLVLYFLSCLYRFHMVKDHNNFIEFVFLFVKSRKCVWETKMTTNRLKMNGWRPQHDKTTDVSLIKRWFSIILLFISYDHRK